MSTFAAMTIKELKALAKDRGVKNYSTMDKLRLVRKLEALEAKNDPSNFADMPDDIEPAPDYPAEATEKPRDEPKMIAPVPVEDPEPEPVEEAPKKELPTAQAFKLMNDCRFMKPDGTAAILKAGRTLKSNEYDLERVKASGGVLTPLVK